MGGYRQLLRSRQKGGKKMKKIIIVAFLILSLTVSFVSCGEFVPADRPTGGTATTEGSGDADTTPSGDTGEPSDTTVPDGPFTVTVMLDGKPYAPEASAKPLSVRWTGDRSSYTETVGADGRASVEGLDGDYAVTLLNIPKNYTYNPNIYKATNTQREITVELIKLTKTIGDGDGLYRCINLNKTGFYRAEIESAGQIIYYEFKPPKAGVYHVESIVDVTANMYNPILKVYTGTSAAKFEQDEVDGGGTSSTYTKNFLYEIKMSEEYMNNTYTFAIRVEGKDATYPTFVDFSVTYKGTYEEVFGKSELIYPEFDFEDQNRFPEGYVSYLDADKLLFGSNWVDAAERVDGKMVFNNDGYKLNPDDGFYHAYDEIKYVANGGWGPILYADVARPHIFAVDDLGLNLIEYEGNKTLTVSEGTENYKLFIEGFAGATNLELGHNFFCNSDCPCRETNGGGCKESQNCDKCLPTCRPVPDRAYGMKGYADYAIDGRVPVTEELASFLQKLAISQRYFSDGNGWIEGFGYTAFEDSQWLFPCGYYTN